MARLIAVIVSNRGFSRSALTRGSIRGKGGPKGRGGRGSFSGARGSGRRRRGGSGFITRPRASLLIHLFNPL